jgi:hypothetical protein
MKKRRPAPSVPIDFDIPLELAQRFAAHCASEGVTEREALEAALRKYFAGLQETALVAQKLDELEESAAETERTLKRLAQAYASFAGVAGAPPRPKRRLRGRARSAWTDRSQTPALTSRDPVRRH